MNEAMTERAPAGIEWRAASAADWPLVEGLFGARGACGGCWCMYWLAPPGEAAWAAMKGAPNRQALRRQLESGECRAVLATERERAIGWCRAGPTSSFPRLARSRKLVRETMADWAIVCLFVASSHRRRGLSAGLLRSAVRLAAAEGALSVEGYPVVAGSRAIPDAFAWTGLPSAFEAAGFVRDPHEAGSRCIYRMDLA